ncbi:unnamed protein product [Heterobilharzia americana]|nr:unnamed protein product [Heterobilharzia americana]
MFCCIPNVVSTRRVKIDRYSIGNPIDFRHVSHMGSSALYEDDVSSALGLLDHQSLPVHLKLIDLPKLSNNNTSLSADTLVPSNICINSTISYSVTNPEPILSTATKSSKRNSFLNTTSVLPESTETGNNVMRHSAHLGGLKPSRVPSLDLSLPLPPPPPPPPPVNAVNLFSMLRSS